MQYINFAMYRIVEWESTESCVLGKCRNCFLDLEESKSLFETWETWGIGIEPERVTDCDRHGPCSKPTHAILLCTWERHSTALYPVWWS